MRHCNNLSSSLCTNTLNNIFQTDHLSSLPCSDLKLRVRIFIDGTLIIYRVKPEDAGKYTCSPSNSLGISPSASAYLTVQCEFHLQPLKEPVAPGLLLKSQSMSCVPLRCFMSSILSSERVIGVCHVQGQSYLHSLRCRGGFQASKMF